MNKGLSAFQYFDKFIDVNHINERKRCLFQNIVMIVLCDDIAGISLEGTVHELAHSGSVPQTGKHTVYQRFTFQT